MTRISTTAASIGAAFAIVTGVGAFAQSPVPAQVQAQTRAETQERAIYGSQLMTQQERTEYQQRMRELKTQEERDQFRKEHHTKMQERAKERGMKLPDDTPARGQGAGPRSGAGGGTGGGPRGGGGRP